ncbi:MAG: hypothetical protein U1E73_00375 [Planctomycetota bacterium]
MVKTLEVALAVSCAGLVTSQQTVTVGANAGDLAAAVAAAGPWDTLVLAFAATYSAVTIDKPLSIVGSVGSYPQITSMAIVAGAIPGFVSLSRVSLWGISMQAPTTIEDCVISYATAASTQVSLHRCTIGSTTSMIGPNIFQGGVVRLTRCTIVGRDASWYSGGPIYCGTIPSSVALVATGCQLWLGDTVVLGGAGLFPPCFAPYYVPASPAIVGSGELHISGGSIRCGINSNGTFAVQWSGPFEHDPSTQFIGSLSQHAPIFLPRTGGNGALRGNSMSVNIVSLPSVPAVLAASLGMPSSTTWSQGTSWLDPNAFVLLTIGFTDGSGNLGAAIPVPSTAARGLVITVQGAAVSGATGQLAAGVPVVLHVL